MPLKPCTLTINGTLTINVDDHYGTAHTMTFDLSPSEPEAAMLLFRQVCNAARIAYAADGRHRPKEVNP